MLKEPLQVLIHLTWLCCALNPRASHIDQKHRKHKTLELCPGESGWLMENKVRQAGGRFDSLSREGRSSSGAGFGLPTHFIAFTQRREKKTT